ncbi:MAG: ParB/RepB/Spo0J family partition protein [Lachnospiraceae bacterium]
MKTRSGKPVHLIGYEELLSVPTIAGASDIPLEQLHEFKNHPFHVVEDEAMMELVESIKTNGILSPAIARRRPEGGFELISGHRRKHAAKLAGLEKMPVFVKEMTDDEAVIVMVDSNIQREEILPSERAFAFKMKMEAMKHQGVASGHNVPKQKKSTLGHYVPKSNDANHTAEMIGSEFGITGRQVKRYIRLTYLIPELLELLDMKKLTFINAVDISFFPENAQREIYDYISQKNKLSKDKIGKIKNAFSTNEDMSVDEIRAILYEKSNTIKQVYFSLTENQIASYFPKGYTMQQMEEVILTLLEKWSKKEKR